MKAQFNGMKIKIFEFLLSQFADYSTLILQDSEESLNSSLSKKCSFYSCSGLTAKFVKKRCVHMSMCRLRYVDV